MPLPWLAGKRYLLPRWPSRAPSGRVAAMSGEGRPKVYSLAIETTPFCNQRCAYCYNEWRDDNGAALETGGRDKLLLRVERLLTAWDIDHVTVTGGEPLAHPGVFDLMDRIASHGVGIQMISNGALVTEELSERLAERKLRYVQVTLNGPDAALHEALVGPGHFDKTVRGIELLRTHGVPVVGCIVITKTNHAQVGDTLALFAALGVRQIALSRFSPAGYATRHAARLLPTRGELLIAFRQALPFGRERGMKLHSTMPVPPCTVEVEELEPIQFGTCPIGTSMQELALGPDGRLKNCTLHTTALGRVNDVLDPSVDLVALLGAAERMDYRRQIPEFCMGCMHASTCGGGCGAAAEWVSGHARRFPDPLVSQHVDDDLAERFARERRDGKTRLEVLA